MADPILGLAGDPQRMERAVGGGDVAGEFLVGEVGIVLERAGRLDDVDASTAFAFGRLGAPGGGFQRGAELDVLQPAIHEIAAEARPDVSPTFRPALVRW
jgi:hypothetical protein